MSDISLLKPLVVFEQLFEKNIRLDDRGPLEPAPIQLSSSVLPSCHGSALVHLGHTQVICGVQVKVIPEQMHAGRIVCLVEISRSANRSASTSASSPTNREAQALTSKLQRLIDTFVCPDAVEQLHLYAGSDSKQAVASYALKLDVLVLHDDGCLLDACVPAAVLALHTTRWRKLVAVSDDRKNIPFIHCYEPCPSGEMMRLTINESPIPVTVCFLPLPVLRKSNSLTSPFIFQPSRRELSLWDTDAGPVQLLLTPDARLLDICLVNAFLPGLFGSLVPPEIHTKQTDSTLFDTLFHSTEKYAADMYSAFENAIKQLNI
ncbi:unnamed protein product [Dicrocoelium dendriticum]|nr:unnamed protein product [Dicrocoelium dendriticum]